MGRTRRSLSLPSKATPRPAKAPAPKVDLGVDLRARIAARQEQRAGASEDVGFSYADFKQRRSEKAAVEDEDVEDEEALLRHLGDDEDDDLLRMGAECEREAPVARAVAGGGGSLGSRSSQSRPRQVGVESEREDPDAQAARRLSLRPQHELRKREHSRISKKRRDQRRGDLKYGGGAAAAAVESEREGAAAGVEHMVWSAGSTLDFVGGAAGEPPAVGTPAASAALHAVLHAPLPAAPDDAAAAAEATSVPAAAAHGGRPAACVRTLWPAESAESAESAEGGGGDSIESAEGEAEADLLAFEDAGEGEGEEVGEGEEGASGGEWEEEEEEEEEGEAEEEEGDVDPATAAGTATAAAYQPEVEDAFDKEMLGVEAMLACAS
jgi:hypothetical protein